MLCQMPKIYILHNLFSKILDAQHEKILLVGMNQTSRLSRCMMIQVQLLDYFILTASNCGSYALAEQYILFAFSA